MIKKTILVISIALFFVLVFASLGLIDPYAHPKLFVALSGIFGILIGTLVFTPFFLDMRRKR